MPDLRDLLPGQEIEADLALREKRGIAPYQSGYFYRLVLGNRTGEVPAKVWLGPDEAAVRAGYETLDPGQVLRVTARVSEYRGQLELSME
ncbi:MAG: OB-fold nucleic acid binding domain-containing protein, partial [Candidatus Thermoplasmatota archaeon]|nr:OB-fold nucleic acid binding domain-containing protein [Candidatus Thermoplasmatota archaeon]